MLKSFQLYLIIFFIFSCTEVFESEDIFGCNNQRACNYSPEVTAYWSGSCEYPEDIYGGSVGDFSCSGECLVDYDCNGDCGGNVIDSDGDNICDDIDICLGDFSQIYNMHCSDLQVLNEIKNSNIGSSLDSLEIFDIVNSNCIINEFGRLEYLALPNQNIFNIPPSIQFLDSLKTLYLNDNVIDALPNSICNISDECEIFMFNNNLCPEYQFDCIDHWGEQNCNE